MGFFDDLKERLTNASKEVSQKVNDTVAVTKLQGQISSKENGIKEAFIEIGKAVFEKYKDDENSEFFARFKEITGLQDEIAGLKDQIDVIKGIVRCPVCGEAVEKGAQFCPKCGAKMPEIVEEVKEAAEEAAETAEETAQETAETVEEMVEKAEETREEAMTEGFEKAEEKVGEVVEEVKEAAEEAAESVKEFFH